MNALFEQLIRVGLGQQENLTATPTEEEWEQLHELCYEQSLLGIGYQGASRVRAFPEMAQKMSRSFMLKWHLEAEEIKAQNEKFYRKCVKLERKFAQDGRRTSILKGQALAAIYQTASLDLRMLRQCGDIDLWMEGGRDQCLSYLREKFGSFHFDYKHAQPHIFDEVEVEVHWIPEICANLLTNRRLLRLWTEQKENLCSQRVKLPGKYGEVHTLDSRLNGFYVLLHCYRHFMLGGIGMKQVMDIYFVLRQLSAEDRESVMSLVRQLNMTSFVAALMWILLDVFHLERGQLLCAPDEAEGRFVLKELYRYGQLGAQDKEKQSNKRSRGLDYLRTSFRHLMHISSHYPKEALCGPVWIVYHFGWRAWYKFIN